MVHSRAYNMLHSKVMFFLLIMAAWSSGEFRRAALPEHFASAPLRVSETHFTTTGTVVITAIASYSAEATLTHSKVAPGEGLWPEAVPYPVSWGFAGVKSQTRACANDPT